MCSSVSASRDTRRASIRQTAGCRERPVSRNAPGARGRSGPARHHGGHERVRRRREHFRLRDPTSGAPDARSRTPLARRGGLVAERGASVRHAYGTAGSYPTARALAPGSGSPGAPREPHAPARAEAADQERRTVTAVPGGDRVITRRRRRGIRTREPCHAGACERSEPDLLGRVGCPPYAPTMSAHHKRPPRPRDAATISPATIRPQLIEEVRAARSAPWARADRARRLPATACSGCGPVREEGRSMASPKKLGRSGNIRRRRWRRRRSR